MSTIDERIVNLRFDNQNFEFGAQQSMRTLSALKNSLSMDSSTKALNNISKAVGDINVSSQSAASGIDQLANRFSTMGIVGMAAIQNITNSVMGIGTKLWSSIIGPIKSGGWNRALNIEQAKFQFKGLGMDVEEAMKNANDAVTGTAYGLDAAARVAAQFGASGIKTGKEMTKALRGISGVAAMTSSSYDDIGQVFTRVAGQGRVMANDLNSLAARGLNAAAEMAKAMHMSEAELRDMVSKGKVDFKMFYTAMDNAFGEHAKAANDTFTGSLSNVKSALGRIGAKVFGDTLVDMRDIFNSLIPVINGVNESLDPFIGFINKLQGGASKKISSYLNAVDLTNLKKNMVPAVQSMENVFNALLSIIRPITEAFRNIFPSDGGKRISSLIEWFSKFTEKLILGEKASTNLQRTFEGIFSVAKVVAVVVESVVKAIGTLVNVVFPARNGILYLTGAIGDFANKISDSIVKSDGLNKLLNGFGMLFKGVGTVAKNIGVSVKNTIDYIFGALGSIPSMLSEALSSINTGSFFKIINSALLTGFLHNMRYFAVVLGNMAKDLRNKGNTITFTLGAVRDVLRAYEAQIKADTIIKIAKAVLMLAGGLFVLATIKPERLTSALTGVSVLLWEMYAVMIRFEGAMAQFKSSSIVKLAALTVALNSLGTAVLIFSVSIKRLASMSFGGMIRGLVGVAAICQILIHTSSSLASSKTKLVSGSAGLLIFAESMVIMSNAIKELGSLDVNTILKGLGGVLALCMMFSKTTSTMNISVSSGLGILAIAEAITILSKSVKQFGGMNTENLAKGLLSIGSSLAILSLFLRSLSGLNVKNIGGVSVGLVVISSSLLIFSKVVKTLGTLKTENLVKGISAIGASLLIFTLALNGMKSTIAGAAALLVAANAIAVLTPSLMILSAIPLEGVASSLLMLAGTFTVLGVSAAVLGPMMPVILGLSASLATLGIAITALGAGTLVVGIGLTSIATGITALTVAVSEGGMGITNAISTIITTIVDSIPKILEGIATGVVGIVSTIASNAGKLVTSVSTIIGMLLSAVANNIPKFVSLIGSAIVQIVGEIAKNIPKLVQSGMSIILGILQGIANNITSVVKAGIDIVINFIKGVSSKIPDLIDAGFKLVISFINGVAEAIDNNAALVGEAMARMFKSAITSGLKGIGGFAKEFFNAGTDTADNLNKGVESKKDTLKKSGRNASKNVSDGAKSNRSGNVQSGVYIVDGIISGVNSQKSTAINAGINLGNWIDSGTRQALEIKSPSRKMVKNAKYAMLGFVKGIHDNKPLLTRTIKNVFDISSVVVQNLSKTNKEIKKQMSFGNKTASAYAKIFGLNLAKYKTTEKAVTALSKAIKKYATDLYMETDAYKQDTANLKAHQKELKKYNNQVTKLKEDVKKYSSDSSEKGKKRLKELKSNLKSAKEFVKDIKKQIKQDQKEIQENIKNTYLQMRNSIKDSIKDFTDPFKASLDTQIDLFRKFGDETEITSAEIISNMLSQVDGIKQWNEDLATLVQNGFATGLIEKLRDMGPAGANYVKAFMNMTKEEMDNANNLFMASSEITAQTLLNNFSNSLNTAKEWTSKIKALATTGLNKGIVEALSNMGAEGMPYVDALLTMTTTQLKQFNSQYKEYLKLPTELADKVMASNIFARANSDKNIKGLYDESQLSSLSELKDKMTTVTNEMMETIQNTIVDEGKVVSKDALVVSKDIYKALNTNISKPKGAQLGKFVCDGIIVGLDNNESSVSAAARALARRVYEAAKAELDINSPSRKFEYLGEQSDVGMAKGLTKSVSLVTQSAKNVGKAAVSSLKDTISNLYKPSDFDINTSPVIKPVLDLSDIKHNANAINDVLSLGSTLSLATTANGSMRYKDINSQIIQNGQPSQTTIKFEQNNYSPKALSRIDIYRQTKNQFSSMKEVLDNI